MAGLSGARGAGLLVAVLAAAVVAAGRWAARAPGRSRSRRVRRGSDDAALLLVVDQLAGRIAAGSGLVQALADLDPAGPAAGLGLALVGHRMAAGATVAEAFDAWAHGDAPSGAVLVADGLALAGRTGASQAEALARVGRTLRDRDALRGEVRAQSAQARASATLLIAAPAVAAGVFAAADASFRQVLVGSALGWRCLAAGVALDLLGAAWMARLVGAAR